MPNVELTLHGLMMSFVIMVVLVMTIVAMGILLLLNFIVIEKLEVA